MSLHQGSIFKARQSNVSQTNDTSVAVDSTTNFATAETIKTSALELTKNAKYCVSRLPALPTVFNNQEALYNGYTDYRSHYAVVITNDAINVWNYKSTDASPLLFQFPLETTSLPLAIITNPVNGTSNDPGLAIINSETGHVKFYESVQHAPALGLINNKSLESTIKINSANGEFVTLAENVEPAGIVLATSWKRVVLVSIRDFKGKPQLSATELLSPSRSTSLFSSFFSKGEPSDKKVDDEVVSIRSGTISNKGFTQEIIIQDSMGGFYCFTYQLSSASGLPYIDKKRSYRHNLSPYVENNLDGFVPGSAFGIRFLDLWPLELQDQTDIYAALVAISDDFKQDSRKKLLIITIKIDSSGALLYGTHTLSSLEPHIAISLVNKPKLYIPKPGSIAFVIIDNVVVLTDIDTSYIENKSLDQYYTSRWEDVVRLKSSVQIIGEGYENPSTKANPALILLTDNSGVLRIERFRESKRAGKGVDTDPLKIVKSHIEQGIFYNGSTTIEFDVAQTYDNDVIVEAVNQIIQEILHNTSPYLPSFLPSTKDFLELKLNLLGELVSFSKRNFPQAWPNLAASVIKSLEMADVSLGLWNGINTNSANSEGLKNILVDSITKTGFEYSAKDDKIRKFFGQGTEQVNEVLTSFVELLLTDNFPLELVIDLLVRTMYEGVLKNEEKYVVVDDEIPIFRLWVFDSNILIRIEEIFSLAYDGSADSMEVLSTSQMKSNLIKVAEVLYYFCHNAIDYMKKEGNSNEQLKEYMRWFNVRKSEWCKALIKHGLNTEAIVLTEKYRDFATLAEVLESERSKVIEDHGKNSLEYDTLMNRYENYFRNYGYDFAVNLYTYYLKSDKIFDLLSGFESHNDFLIRFLTENPGKTGEVAWIRQLIDGDFANASQTIVKSADLKKDDYQYNRELKYSIGKLAAIAAKGSSSGIALDEIIEESENNLIQVRVQNKLYEELSQYVHGEKELLKFNYVLNNFTNEKLPQDKVKATIEPFFNRFVEGRPLARSELIEFLSLLKPTANFNWGFVDALKVAALYGSDDSYRFYSQLAWLRLLTLTDDWLVLSDTEKYSDEENKRRLSATLLYKTLSAIGTNSPLVKELDALVQDNGEFLMDFGIAETTQDFNSVLLSKLGTIKEYNLVSWIEALKVDIASGVLDS